MERAGSGLRLLNLYDDSMVYKIWDNKFKHYCLTLYTREQAETMVRHFEKMDRQHREDIKNRYRIDEVRA